MEGQLVRQMQDDVSRTCSYSHATDSSSCSCAEHRVYIIACNHVVHVFILNNSNLKPHSVCQTVLHAVAQNTTFIIICDCFVSEP